MMPECNEKLHETGFEINVTDEAYYTANAFVQWVLLSDVDGDFHQLTQVQYLNYKTAKSCSTKSQAQKVRASHETSAQATSSDTFKPAKRSTISSCQDVSSNHRRS